MRAAPETFATARLYTFRVLERLCYGVVAISTNGERAMWTLRSLRKSTRCAATGEILIAGQRHYGPVGNMVYRYVRLHRRFVDS